MNVIQFNFNITFIFGLFINFFLLQEVIEIGG
jgi:hypothetical protein